MSLTPTKNQMLCVTGSVISHIFFASFPVVHVARLFSLNPALFFFFVIFLVL